MQPNEWLEIGKIVSAQGLKGELRIYPNTDFPERFVQPGKRWILRPGSTELESIELKSGRYLNSKGLYLVRFAGIDDRTQAEALRDCRIFVPEGDRPLLEEDEFHVPDLLGLEVFEQATQRLIGIVTDVIPAGNDLLEVQPTDNAEAPKILIPFVKAIVPVVDLPQRRIEITPPTGLID
ncbi:ribosome maturation factor RimM [Phormidium tenue FACHB-886]|nr:ribosome maturation factor RimM [Phormidium tenue FACHB-886]